jgi:hypothetical protein
MAKFRTNITKYKPSRQVDEEWNSFKKGWNQIVRETELDNEEMAVSDNIMLVGKGVPTGRWGSVKYFTANATGSIRGFATYKTDDEVTNEILAVSDQGILAKKDGTSSTAVTGQSWPSGSIVRSAQLGGTTYLVSKDASFTEYDGTNLSVYATITPPTGVGVTNFSGATGTNRISWQVVTVGPNSGQTTASDNYVLESLPTELSDSEYHVFWTGSSAATISGYEVYRGTEGNETYLASVEANTTTYVDRGGPASELVEPPLTNTTGGVKSKFIKRFKDRLLVVPNDEPNKLLVSGKYPDHTKFSLLDGGGGVFVEPGSGDNITALAVQPITDRIVVYKNYSSYLVELSQVQVGNFFFLDPQYQAISTSVGCSNQDTVVTVENDSFYFGRDGLYVTGYEPNFLNILRTNEVSARIRSYLDNLNDDDYKNSCAFYVDKKYVLSFPDRKEMVVYDRERGALFGPWKMPFGISHMLQYTDGTGTEKWVIGSSSTNQVYVFDIATNTDDGTAVTKTIKTRKSYFKDFTRLNIIRFFYILFRNIIGTVTVNINIEDKDGTASTTKSFTISGTEAIGSTGWGMDQFGMMKWGLPSQTQATTEADETTKWGTLFKQVRLVQVEVTSSAANANFELLKIKLEASEQTSGILSSSQRA